ncbi:hypothetical protein CCACVL1_30308 [Corchorus capsularis]|uniref:Uncharacterized protein n=1 Tax=Corchorus capsularis TaxID=210143 RepID=A0A1R3FXY4_COCAP|nr:hypothetical protein CCACVL1_30308 [Corchorus capsularis]
MTMITPTTSKEVQHLDTTIEQTTSELRIEFRSGIDAMNTEMRQLFQQENNDLKLEMVKMTEELKCVMREKDEAVTCNKQEVEEAKKQAVAEYKSSLNIFADSAMFRTEASLFFFIKASLQRYPNLLSNLKP